MKKDVDIPMQCALHCPGDDIVKYFTPYKAALSDRCSLRVTALHFLIDVDEQIHAAFTNIVTI